MVRSVKFFVLCAFACVTHVEAATIQAASCNRDHVAGAVNSAGDGDTIVIPAGTCTWTQTLLIEGRYFTLRGAGKGQTIILDGVQKDSFNAPVQALRWIVKPGGLTRITGIEFRQVDGINDPYNSGMIHIWGAGDQFRMDNLHLELNKSTGALLYNVQGVYDHNSCNSEGFHTCIYVHAPQWGGAADFGDGAWADDSYLGTSKATFIEDSTFTSPGIAIAIDGWMGSHVVFRHNTLVNMVYSNHGTDTPGRWRGQRTFEVCDNTFDNNNQWANWTSSVGIRSGVGVICNNSTITRNGGTASLVGMLDNFRRLDQTRAYDPWGFCTGSNPWDGNTDGTGYPCMDQPGRGKGKLVSGFSPTPTGSMGQALDPVYGWGNTLNGNASPIWSRTDNLQEGRDYINSPKPGYSPYQYPHPLVSGGSAPPPPSSSGPAPPQNLRIIGGTQ
jgi:hypothetical protein